MNFISKTPCRVSLFGGGTDYEQFIKDRGGSDIISFTINKYVYSVVKENRDNYKIYDEKYRLNYFNSESVQNKKNIKNKIIREVLKYLNINEPYYISLFSDIASGTGLGSSSAFIVNLIKVFSKIKKKEFNDEKIFRIALEIERKTLNPHVGLQDHAAAVYGGFNHFKFKRKKIIVNSLKKYEKNLNLIINNSVFIWTGISRNSKKILNDQKKNWSKKIVNLKNINSLCIDGIKEIKKENINIKNIGEILKQSFYNKQTLSKYILNKKLNDILSYLSKGNSYGYKILGAGGGGFIFCVLNKKQKKKLYSQIVNKKNLQIIDIKFEPNSTQMVKL